MITVTRIAIQNKAYTGKTHGEPRIHVLLPPVSRQSSGRAGPKKDELTLCSTLSRFETRTLVPTREVPRGIQWKRRSQFVSNATPIIGWITATWLSRRPVSKRHLVSATRTDLQYMPSLPQASPPVPDASPLFEASATNATRLLKSPRTTFPQKPIRRRPTARRTQIPRSSPSAPLRPCRTCGCSRSRSFRPAQSSR